MSASADVALNKGLQPKSKRSFISRLPSFRKKKTPPVQESDLDMHLRSAEEDLHGGVKIRPPNQVKNRKDDDVKRRSKTSSIVASYEKRLSDLKDEEIRTNGKKNKVSKAGGKSATLGQQDDNRTSQQDRPATSNKTSRFGFGFAWQKITSFENSTGNGKKNNVGNERNHGDEFNANVHQERITGCGIKSHSLELHLPHGSPPERDSNSSIRTPESDRSSVSSNSSAKVYGQPMPYRSVFSDEPRGLKRQVSSSQSDGFNSSGISMSRSTSPLHDVSNLPVDTHHDSSENRLQLNSTFTKDSKSGNINSDGLNTTFPIEESPTCIVNRTFKLEPEEECRIGTKNTEATAKQALATEVTELGPKEMPISCATVKPSISVAVGKDSHDVSGSSKAKSLGEVMPPEQDVSRPSASPARKRPTDINSAYSCMKTSHPDPFHSPRHRHTSGTMGGLQSAVDGYSTPTRPMELAFQLRKPHISAIKHCSDSLDSCELDSLCSEDLMCDSRYLDDDMFEARDESSCLLSRSLSVEETAAIYRTQHCSTNAGRNRSVSVDQAQCSSVCSLEKRVGVTRGLSPSPLALPVGRRGGRSHHGAEDLCQSPVEELQSLIFSAKYSTDSDRNKNGNTNCSRVHSNSVPSSHPLRPPRWPTLPLEEEGAVILDAAVYRHMVQDMTSVKTMLLKLKRALQTVENSSSPFEHSLGLNSPYSSLPTSPVSEANTIHDAIIEDLREENTVLRKEVKNLQELLADAQHQLNERNVTVQENRAKPELQSISTQCAIEMLSARNTKDQSLQVNLPPPSVPSKAPPSSSPTHRKYRAEVSKIKAAYEEYIQLHSVKGDEQQEKLSHVTTLHDSPLKVGHSPTSPEPPIVSSQIETDLPDCRQHPQHSLIPLSGQGSQEKVIISKLTKPHSSITSISSKDSSGTNSLPVIPQNNVVNDRSQNVKSSQVSGSTPVSPNRKGVTAYDASQSPRVSRPKRQGSRSKLMQPVSYKAKIAGSQDSLQSECSQPDDGSKLVDDRKGGPVKRPLASSQSSKSCGIPQKPPSGRQLSLDLQQKSIKEINGSIDGIPKPKDIRMMPSRQKTGNTSGLPQREGSGVVLETQSPVDQRQDGTVLPKQPMPKASNAAKPQAHGLRCDDETQLPVTDANSNPVSQRNGLPAKMSGLQHPQVIRKVDQAESTVTQQKAGANPSSQFIRRKQSPTGLSRTCPSQSPERLSSDEDKSTPPSSPRARAQQQQKGSRIAMPVRGRGACKVPRGSGIPTRRTNNS